MHNFIKKCIGVTVVCAALGSFFSLSAQNVGTKAPKFSMYQYKDKIFSTDSVYGRKVVTFVFGSIT